MPDENPYLAPAYDPNPSYDVPQGGKVWRQGKLLLLDRGASLPPRCVWCNSSSRVRLTERKLIYKPFWPFQRLHKATVVYGFCARCRLKQGLSSVVLLALLVCGATVFVLSGLAAPQSLARVLGISLGILCLSATPFFNQWIQLPRATRIDDAEIAIAGVCPAYLNELPSGP